MTHVTIACFTSASTNLMVKKICGGLLAVKRFGKMKTMFVQPYSGHKCGVQESNIYHVD